MAVIGIWRLMPSTKRFGGNMWNDIKIIKSSDTNVLKYVFTSNTAVAESVLYKYPTYKERTVICCSTQSGCPIGCRFCGAGDNFVRSLTIEEIVEQPLRLLSDTGVRPAEMDRLQIMFMSMGEPMLNAKNLSPALRQLHGLFPNAALLISTSAPDVDYRWLQDLSVEIPTIGLQFSVHESTDERRNKLIPFLHKLTLEQIAERGNAWHKATGRSPFFNYCAQPENVSDDDADRLAALFDPTIWQATISVVCERDEGVAAANQRQRDLAEAFSVKLLNRGFGVRVFNPSGQDDIGGGCGQLHFIQQWMKNNPDKAHPSIGSKFQSIHAPRLENIN